MCNQPFKTQCRNRRCCYSELPVESRYVDIELPPDWLSRITLKQGSLGVRRLGTNLELLQNADVLQNLQLLRNIDDRWAVAGFVKIETMYFVRQQRPSRVYFVVSSPSRAIVCNTVSRHDITAVFDGFGTGQGKACPPPVFGGP